MIKSIKLRNFQGHKKSKLVLDDGVNIIIGKSDSGKTSIFRAFNWLLTNRPGGADFRSWWGGDTSVSIKTKEGDLITRNKTNKENSYELSSIEDPFKAFGTDIPEEIQQALNMSSINVQQQASKLFLLDATSGAVASHFNKIANLQQIDTSQQYIQKQINTINQDIKHAEKEIERKNNQLKKYDNLDHLEKELKHLLQLQKTVDSHNNDILKIEYTIIQVNGLDTLIEKNTAILKKEKQIDILINLLERLESLQEQCKKIKQILNKIDHTKQKIEFTKKIAEKEKDVNELLTLYNKRTETKLKLTKLVEMCSNIDKNTKSLETNSNKLQQDIEIFEEAFPDICPLCETGIEHAHAKN